MNLPGNNLLVHVIEQLSSPVLVDDGEICLEGVHQMPVPMVQVDANVLAEVRHALLGLGIRGRQVGGDYHWHLKIWKI